MPKVFYTEHDIEDLMKRGVLSLEVNDNVVLTDLAYEKANRLGMKLIREKPDNPPAAPVRPYLSQSTQKPGVAAARPTVPVTEAATSSLRAQEPELQQRIRNAVIARLGNQVDPALLDVIIQRVLASTGVK